MFLSAAVAALTGLACHVGQAAGARAVAAPPAPTVFVAAGGSDANPGTRDRPVVSFSRAYALARSGTVVEVAGGS